MDIVSIIECNECIYEPYTSIQKLENDLFEYGYVVLKERETFYGILTIRDLAQNYHQLAIDCITPKPPLSIKNSLEEVVHLFLESKQMVLPVFDGPSYRGSILFRKLLREILYIQRGIVNVEVKNVIGNTSFENAKYSFISQMLHHTKNPIQTIISATHLIEEDTSRKDISIFLNAIRTSAEEINILFDKLLAHYLENNTEGCG